MGKWEGVELVTAQATNLGSHSRYRNTTCALLYFRRATIKSRFIVVRHRQYK